jgi:hypothetical protein
MGRAKSSDLDEVMGRAFAILLAFSAASVQPTTPAHAQALAPACRPTRGPSSVAVSRVELALPAVLAYAVSRQPATYIPRADEFRQDLRQFERRIQGVRQDIMDFMEFRPEFQKALQNFRRLYPHQAIAAEDELATLYAVMAVAFDYFGQNPRPEAAACLNLVSRLENEFLRGDIRQSAPADDVMLVVRISEKLCRLR